MEEQFVETLKELRLSIDTISQLAENAANNSPEGITTEMHYVVYSMKMAKAYSGKLLGTLPNNPSPYKNDGNRKTVADIEPEADKTEVVQFTTSSYIERIDILRKYIGDLANRAEAIDKEYRLTNREASIYRTQMFVHLTDARLYLGWELGRIRDRG